MPWAGDLNLGTQNHDETIYYGESPAREECKWIRPMYLEQDEVLFISVASLRISMHLVAFHLWSHRLRRNSAGAGSLYVTQLSESGDRARGFPWKHQIDWNFGSGQRIG